MRPSTYKKKILIVDDDPTSLKVLESILPVVRYKILKANNGEEALESAFREPPDLILLDIMLPGIDGYEVTRRIKRDNRTKDVPIIIITSLDKSEAMLSGLEEGAEELLRAGANMVGGCCGITPEHIAAIAATPGLSRKKKERRLS